MTTQTLQLRKGFDEPFFGAAEVVDDASFFIHCEAVFFSGLLHNFSQVDNHLFIKRVRAAL